MNQIRLGYTALGPPAPLPTLANIRPEEVDIIQFLHRHTVLQPFALVQDGGVKERSVAQKQFIPHIGRYPHHQTSPLFQVFFELLQLQKL
jgi:hypothetical protein